MSVQSGSGQPHESVIPPSKLALLFPAGRLETTPTVKHLASALSDHFRVEVFTVKNAHVPAPTMPSPNLRLFIYPVEQNMLRENVPALTFKFWRWFTGMDTGQYDAYVAAGIRGLFIATARALVDKKPVIYHCLELYPQKSFRSGMWRIYKRLERWCARRASMVLVQDSLRADLLVRDTGLNPANICYFPVSSAWSAHIHRSTWLHRRFNISKEKKLVLCAGTVYSSLIPALEIVEAAQSWPDDWILVLHSNESDVSIEVVNRLKIADRRCRVVFSNEPVPYDELQNLIGSADVGLALYNQVDDNIRYMGLSSGKLAEYAACGVPVVVTDLPGIGDLVRKYRFGKAIGTVAELRDAIGSILSDRLAYQERAIAFFDAELDLRRFTRPIIERLITVIDPPPS